MWDTKKYKFYYYINFMGSRNSVNEPKKNVLMIGVYNAGKDTFLRSFGVEVTCAEPITIGYPAFKVETNGLAIYCWSSTHEPPLCLAWRKLFDKPDAIIFIIDSTESDKVEETYKGFRMLINDTRVGKCPILIFANKQDLPNALSIEEVDALYGFSDLENERLIRIQPCSALQKTGLMEGLDWILNGDTRNKTVKSARSVVN